MAERKIEMDRGIETVELASFDEFTAFIGEKHWNTHGVVFRGQREAEWSLQCTLRRLVCQNLSEEHLGSERVIEHSSQRDGRRARDSFRRRSKYFNEDWRDCRDDELWALLQHHGGPTPLLDWTKSPFVAAFWAFADVALSVSDRDKAGGKLAVWGLHCHAVQSLCDAAPSPIQFKLIEGTLPTNRRLAAQQGVFTFTDPIVQLDQWIQNNQVADTWHERYLLKIVLPWVDTDRALTSLNRMNINFATMYPDLGGAALHAKLNALSPNYEGLNPPEEPLMRPGST